MRDLLTHLVRRTLRPELTVQPRLPSRYEPPGDAGAATAEIGVEVATRHSAAHSDRTAATVTGGGTHHRPAVPARAAGDADHGNDAPTQPPVRHDGPMSPHPREDGAASATPRMAIRQATPATLAGPVTAAQPLDAERTIAPLVAPVRQGRVDSNAAEPTFLRSPMPALPATPRDGALDRSARHSATTDGSPGHEHNAPAPEIRISIGRIELRATVAEGAGARRPDRAARPAQSLNDYLDARARGGRR